MVGKEVETLAGWFDKVRYKLHGAKKWPWADATVFDYVLGELRQRNIDLRRAELSYSFWIEGHIYSGIAVWDESETDPNQYQKNDVIQIQYNPSNPNESYFPDREELTAAFFLTLMATIVVGLAVIIRIGKSLLHHS